MATATVDLRGADRRPASVPALVVGGALLLTGGGQVLSALVELGVGGSDVGSFALCGLGSAALGLALLTGFRPPERMPLGTLVGAAAAGFTAMVAAGTLPYLATGVTSSVLDAAFEATAGITTTAASTFARPEEFSRGMQISRAISQWLGGLGAIALALVLLPYFGTGEGELAIAPPSTRWTRRYFRRSGTRLRPVAAWYGIFTGSVFVAYLLAGMGAFDAVAHALTTVSTGGLSTRTGSMAEFGPAVQWVANVAMFAAGGNVALYVRAARTGLKAGTLRRSIEFRSYLVVVVVAGGWVGASLDGALTDRVRLGFAHALSVITTTGFSFGGQVGAGPLTLLVVLAGIGAMSGSPSGGFRVLRVLALLGYVRREVARQLHDRAVVVVRIGRDVVDEAFLSRIIGYQAVFTITAFVGAVALTVSGEELMDAITASISGIATLGTVPGGEGITQLGELRGVGRVVALLLMAIGRLEVYPLVLVVSAGVDLVAPARRYRALVASVSEWRSRR